MKDCNKHEHPDHSAQIPNLNRVSGQIEGIRKMIEEKRYCPEIITQLRATRSAIKSLEVKILEAHLNSCVAEAMKLDDESEKSAKIDELLTIFKRFDQE